MSKVAHYLQEHLTGEVITSADARRYFATDHSIFTLTPALVVYPRNENDVRKAARFTWQLAERGRVIPITARGAGTDQSGAALGSGIILAFPAHMNKILELDPKSGSVAVQPGLNYGKLQQTLHTHGRFLPPFPPSYEYNTLGGAIGNNAIGRMSVKYGSTRDYVRAMRVVLANGEVIETHRIGKRELSKKMGLSSLEGEIYRAIDTLIQENKELIDETAREGLRGSAGYALSEVRRKDGSFDLTPLIVGSQGTLGIVTEAIIETETHSPTSTLLVAGFEDIESAAKVVVSLKEANTLPSALELVDQHLLEFVDKTNTNYLKGVVEKPYHKIMLLIEFDESNVRIQKRLVKKARKIIEDNNGTCQIESDVEQQEKLWKIREASSSVISFGDGSSKPLPIVDDGVVPVEKLGEFLENIYGLFEKHHLHVAIWGHAGDGNLRMQPMLDLGQLGDRQKIFRLMDDYYKLVISLGGTISAGNGDGRLRGPYLQEQFGPEMYELFVQTKHIFDPHSILNPGVKVGVTSESIKPLLRNEYSLAHVYDHMPRS